jgi:hypothetical protein
LRPAAKHCPRSAHASIAALRLGFPRVLWIEDGVPEPDRDSGSQRSAWLLRLLAGGGCAVSFQPRLFQKAAAYSQQLRFHGVRVLPLLGPGAQVVAERGGRCLYDGFVIARPDGFEQLAAGIRASCPSAPLLYDTVDVHFLREARAALSQGEWPGSWQHQSACLAQPGCWVCWAGHICCWCIVDLQGPGRASVFSPNCVCLLTCPSQWSYIRPISAAAKQSGSWDLHQAEPPQIQRWLEGMDAAAAVMRARRDKELAHMRASSVTLVVRSVSMATLLASLSSVCACVRTHSRNSQNQGLSMQLQRGRGGGGGG